MAWYFIKNRDNSAFTYYFNISHKLRTFHPSLIIIKPQGFYHLISNSLHYCFLTQNKDWKLIPEQGSVHDLRDKIMLYYLAYTGIFHSSHCLVSCLYLNHCEGEDFCDVVGRYVHKGSCNFYLLSTLWTWERTLVHTVEIMNMNFQVKLGEKNMSMRTQWACHAQAQQTIGIPCRQPTWNNKTWMSLDIKWNKTATRTQCISIKCCT
jgi:hypothetical protein